jgi:L-lactate dehydrogenase complex protein LldE
VAAKPRVALFVACLNDTFFPRVGEAVVRVLRHVGCAVRFPADQTCCGQPAYNSGFREDAARVAERMLDVFAGEDYVVTPSASCATMLKLHLPELLAGEPARAAAAAGLAARTWEFAAFLTEVLGLRLSDLLRVRQPCTFHYGCHARPLISPQEHERVLRDALGAQLRCPAHVDLCCGFGGMFAVEFASISQAMLQDRLDELSATKVELVLCSEAGCALNLAGAAHRAGRALRFKHLAEVIAESLGLMPGSDGQESS